MLGLWSSLQLWVSFQMVVVQFFNTLELIKGKF